MNEDYRDITLLECNSLALGELPKGCTMCRRGEKAVIFITGLCPVNCFYCPISFDRKGKDVIYVNEARIRNVSEAIDEIEKTKALGCSITGGEPLVVFDRVIRFIVALKDHFGSQFHIHLYTSAYKMSKDHIRMLDKSGLDEIRFHIVYYRSTLKAIEFTVKNTHMDVGVEIPVIPGKGRFYKGLLKTLDNIGVKFINLNELEITESNYNRILLRGFEVKKDYTISVKGSEELALKLITWAKNNIKHINVHYCSALFKDAIQTRRRLLRSSLFVRKVYEDITEDGTLRKLVIKGPKHILDHIKIILSRELGEGNTELVIRNQCYELHTSIHSLRILRRLNPKIKQYITVFEIEEYPTSDRIRVIEEPYILE